MRDFTPAGFLLLRALLSGRTSYEEAGKRVHVQPVSGETFLFFKTDEGEFRAFFGLDKPGDKASDVMTLYICKEEGAHRIFFFELKGADYDHAVEQLEQLISAVKTKLSPLLGDALFKDGEPIAVIVSDRGAPKDAKFKERSEKFFKRTKVRLETASKGSVDLRSYLDRRGTGRSR